MVQQLPVLRVAEAATDDGRRRGRHGQRQVTQVLGDLIGAIVRIETSRLGEVAHRFRASEAAEVDGRTEGLEGVVDAGDEYSGATTGGQQISETVGIRRIVEHQHSGIGAAGEVIAQPSGRHGRVPVAVGDAEPLGDIGKSGQRTAGRFGVDPPDQAVPGIEHRTCVRGREMSLAHPAQSGDHDRHRGPLQRSM